MSVEHHHEHAERNEQQAAELEAARREKLEELRQSAEHEPQDAEHRAEAAREVIHAHEPAPEPSDHHEAAPPEPQPKPFLDHRLNYRQTLASLQRQLKPASRAFSKVIHTPAVEKTSEVLERTVARPSVTLGATWTALIVGGVFYFTARHFGYALSGSELLFSFIVGAVIGLIIEGLWRAARGR
jgi:hypothetical protein